MALEHKLLEPEEAARLNEELEQLDEAYFIDRSVHFKNAGLKGEVGKYLSMGDRAMPKKLKEYLYSLAPERDFPLTEVVVNRYREGDFIPPHVDDVGTAHCLLLSLEDSEEGLSTSEGLIKNKAGWCKEISVKTTHWVEPVQLLRHTVIFLYGLQIRI